MIPKNIEEINEEDLQRLVKNKVFEKRTLDYKECLPSDKVSDRTKFLANISSFANASGGDLVYGISEKNGIPNAVIGIKREKIDEAKTGMENMIRDGISPRIIGISIKPVHLKNKKVVLIIRIPKSWNSPHCVIFNHHEKFYTRNNSGKYRMDVPELRIAFTLSETLIERIKQFRDNRISKIYANETPMFLYDNAKVALHLIPLSSFAPGQRYDLEKAYINRSNLEPIYSRGFTYRYNIDGLLIYTEDEKRKMCSYTQFFNNGIIEAVEGKYSYNETYNEKIIYASRYEEIIIKALSKYILFMKEMDIAPPFIVFINFINVKGYALSTGERIRREEIDIIDRDILFLPEVFIEKYEINIGNTLKTTFDTLWNAAGFSGSKNYDKEGNRLE